MVHEREEKQTLACQSLSSDNSISVFSFQYFHYVSLILQCFFIVTDVKV